MMNLLSFFILSFLFSAIFSASAKATENDIKQGKYLATVANCVSCHTSENGIPFAGGLGIKTPMGTIYSSNITADKKTGIGAWSDSEFIAALREGKRKDGENLYPAMPYTSYTLMSDEDALLIKKYLFSLKPVKNKNRKTKLIFPFNERIELAGWNLINFDSKRFKQDMTKTSQWNRGAYLVEALAHCGECHTPRNITMGMKHSGRYSGSIVDGWEAFNITSDTIAGIGEWDQKELVQYLKTGSIDGKAQAAGPMAEVVENSTHFILEEDLKAIALYISGLPAKNPNAETRGRFDWGEPAVDVDTLRGNKYQTSQTHGSSLYLSNCATCHGVTGGGSEDGYYPSLINNSTLGATVSNNLIQTILEGVARKTDASEVFMPSFAYTLSDEQISTLATYLFSQFGRSNIKVNKNDVSELRTSFDTKLKDIKPMHN